MEGKTGSPLKVFAYLCTDSKTGAPLKVFAYLCTKGKTSAPLMVFAYLCMEGKTGSPLKVFAYLCTEGKTGAPLMVFAYLTIPALGPLSLWPGKSLLQNQKKERVQFKDGDQHADFKRPQPDKLQKM